MSEIAGDAFFWVYIQFFLSGAQPPQLYGRGTTQPYLPHHRFTAQKCQITKSLAFETKYYGQPVFVPSS